MDAFFASVEQYTRPSLQGRPVLVAGVHGRGVVAGASYEARTYGARSAMPTSQAKRLCRGRAILVTPRHEVYRLASRKIFAVLAETAGIIEQVSIDEGFAEPAELAGATVARAREWAEAVQQRIDSATGLPCSVGMAATKMDAKMASDLAKPHGVYVVDPARRREIFGPRPVGELSGIGRVAQAKLQRVGVETIDDFLRLDSNDVRLLLGSVGAEIHSMASGDDPRPVAPRAPRKQIGHETTVPHDIRTTDEARHLLRSIAADTVARLHKDGRMARTVTAKVKTTDFQLHTRSSSLPVPTDDLEAITAAALRLMPAPEVFGAFRLVGVSVSGLSEHRQATLFPELDRSLVNAAEPKHDDTGASADSDAARNDADAAAVPEPPRKNRWAATQDVTHRAHGHGWVQGSGDSVVTVRFETARTGPGKALTLTVDDPDLAPADPLDSLGWSDEERQRYDE